MQCDLEFTQLRLRDITAYFVKIKNINLMQSATKTLQSKRDTTDGHAPNNRTSIEFHKHAQGTKQTFEQFENFSDVQSESKNHVEVQDTRRSIRQIYFSQERVEQELPSPLSPTLRSNLPQPQQTSDKQQLITLRHTGSSTLFKSDLQNFTRANPNTATILQETFPRASQETARQLKAAGVTPRQKLCKEASTKKADAKKSQKSSLSTNYKLNYKAQFQQVNENIYTQRQSKNLKVFTLLTYLIGITSIAMVLQYSYQSQTYLNYLNRNQFLLNIKSQLGNPIFNAYGSVSWRLAVARTR